MPSVRHANNERSNGCEWGFCAVQEPDPGIDG
jgi:hypothetical protein